jgi:protein arginine N-methyltransferase 6
VKFSACRLSGAKERTSSELHCCCRFDTMLTSSFDMMEQDAQPFNNDIIRTEKLGGGEKTTTAGGGGGARRPRRSRVKGLGLRSSTSSRVQPSIVGVSPTPAVVAKEGVVSSNFREQDAAYFHAYSHLGVHEEMIKDRARTDAYRDAICFHADAIRDKVVVDVGCGTGILSIFCAFAGARKVYAVEASSISVQAKEVVKANSLSDIITVVHGRVEEVEIEEEEGVDVIVSEWMGYALLYESMLSSVINARDRWLKPGGLMLPSYATLYMAPITNSLKYAQSIDFWRNVYGIDMSAMLPLAKQISFEEPCIETIMAENVLSWPVVIKHIDCNKVTMRDLETVYSEFCVSSMMKASLHGFALWFDVSFGPRSSAAMAAAATNNPTKETAAADMQSDSSSMDSSTTLSGGGGDEARGFKVSIRQKEKNPRDECIILSTAPEDPPTHWAQTILYVYDPIEVEQDQLISGSIALSKSRENPRFLNIHLEYTSGNRHCVKESVMQ